ncbi:MAG: hypothetical protein ABIA76_03705 [Candidatus Diapherotrites archaeon]
MGITGKGSIYSMDFLFSFLIGIIIIWIILSSFGSGVNSVVSAQKEFDLKRKALLLSEAIVKARNEEKPLMGSAYFNPLKRRVESNKIDLMLFSGIGLNSFEDEEAEINELKISFLDGKEINAAERKGSENEEKESNKGKEIEEKEKREKKESGSEGKEKKNCFGIERFVFSDELIPRKGILLVVLCEK